MHKGHAARKKKGTESGSARRERVKRIEHWVKLLDDIIETQDYIRGRMAVREKASRFYKKFFALNATDRYLVINGLEKTHNDATRLLLERVLISDVNAIVRHEAAYCLGVVGDDKSLTVLRHALINDDNPLVRHEAALSLAEVGTEDDFKYLDQGMKDDNHDVVVSCQFAKEILLDRIALKCSQGGDKEHLGEFYTGLDSQDIRPGPGGLAGRLLRK